MLKVKNVHKSFGENEILKGVDLTVEKGDVVVIIGPSGSGKTTFLRCLDFLETADEGEMDIQTFLIRIKKLFFKCGGKPALFFKTTIFLPTRLHLKM